MSTTSIARPTVGRQLQLTWHQFRYDLLAFIRNRQSRFFTLALPVLFLVIFASVFHNDTVKVTGGRIDTSVSYVPGLITLGIIGAAFVNLVIAVTAQRESGVLKRRRVTPMPAGAIIGGRALTAMTTSLGITAVLLAIGWAAYHAHVPGRSVAALIVTVLLGAAAFCCLGFAVVSLVKNDDAAQPVTQALMLPLYFISGVFVPASTLPHWLTDIAAIFPVRHLAAALLAAYNPHVSGAGFAWRDLLIITAWGIGGLVVALRRFSWVPLGR
jgi:ABC-2 type transport system permease protein